MILIWKIGGAQTVRQRVDSGNEPSGRGKQVAATEKRYQLMAMTTRLCSFAFFPLTRSEEKIKIKMA